MSDEAPPLPTSRGFVTALINSLSAFETRHTNDAQDGATSPNEHASGAEDRTGPPAVASETTRSVTTHKANPLADAPQSVQEVLLTLHVLYPHSLLPALDLLDRGLITRLAIHPAAPTEKTADADADNQTRYHGRPATASPPPSASPGSGANAIYHVRSARAPAGFRRRRAGSGKGDGSAAAAGADAAATSYEVRTGVWNCSCPAFAFAAFPAGTTSDIGEDRAEDDGEGVDETGGVEDTAWVFGGMSRGGEAGAPVCKHLLACVLAERCTLFAEHVQERWMTGAEADGWAAGWGD